jgi:hypothetical protein
VIGASRHEPAGSAGHRELHYAGGGREALVELAAQRADEGPLHQHPENQQRGPEAEGVPGGEARAERESLHHPPWGARHT